jgi:sensor histidine kinase YesM
MKSYSLEIFANILFWILTVWLISTSFSIAFVDIEIIDGKEVVNVERDQFIILQLLTLSLCLMVMFYLNFFHLLRLKYDQNLIKTALISLSYFVLAIFLYHLVEILPMYSNFPRLSLSLSIGIATFYYAISTTYALVKVWSFSENNRKKLLYEKQQTELSLLRSQLHPHFLFNTLNNLLSMVDQKSNPNLADSLNTLSNLLRYIVYETTKGKVSVDKEIEFVKNFSALQRLRFNQDEVDYNFEIIGNHNQQVIEPGIFIPFVENAFKYGVEIESISQIKIQFDLSNNNRILFSISNSIHENSSISGGSGSGLKRAKERLNLVYPSKHKLEIITNNFFNVVLEIQTDERNNY